MSEPAAHVPAASVARLPLYLRCLDELASADLATVSSSRLAELAGVNAAKLRKDLSHLGSYGTRGVGYQVAHLRAQIRRALGLEERSPVLVIGLGNLGQALSKHAGFSERGFPIAALFDVDPGKVGRTIAGMLVAHVDDLGDVVAESGVRTAIITTPVGAAQEVTDLAVAAGITSVLNFAPTVVQVPDGVALRQVDLALELQILGYYQLRDERGGRDERDINLTASAS